MRLLVLGGTVFLGRHVAEEAVRRGHEVTLFHRGRHGLDVLAGRAEHVLGDREGDLSALAGRAWDAAVDTSGYAPGPVARSSALDVGHLVFVSSISAYPGWPEEHVDEDTPASTEQGEEYGALKAAAERAAEAARPGRVAIVRAGLLCGPHDNIGRLSWWIERAAAGGEVLAPGDPARELQLVDARDLAAWMVDLAERRQAGVFNGTGPRGQTTMGALLDAAIAVTGSRARLCWRGDDALLSAGVEPWTELPLWHPAPGTWAVGTERAQAAGLRCRPVAETVADTWAWLRWGDGRSGYRAALRPSGISREREARLLAG
ncbi:MAG: NAD-dependent epimerase/dehydratase family protein [Solirubrobacteraceae bacterium]